MRVFPILLISFSISLQTLLATLSIYSPPSLIHEYNGKPIQYAIANFGHIPYGRTIIGPVIMADPETGCEPLKIASAHNQEESPILLVKRGNCTFVTKVRYAQLAGVKLVIIMDNKEEKSENLIPVDDGHGYAVMTPSILIEKEDGDKIIKYLTNQDETLRHVVLTIKFDTQQTKHVNYTFWLTTATRQSFKLVREFKEYHFKLGSSVSFTPRYAIWTCLYCAYLNYTNKETPDNCISRGRYCCPDPDGFGPANGRDMILEDLRQICIYRTNPELVSFYLNFYSGGIIWIKSI